MPRTFWLALVLAGCSAPKRGAADLIAGQIVPIGGDETEVREADGGVFRIRQGQRGDPAKVGCSDGQREGFVQAAIFPTIAGCLGVWQGERNLRSEPTGTPCGDDLGPCAAPADLCAPGWRICGSQGAVSDLAARVSAEECEHAGAGRYVAAISHCAAQEGCKFDTPGGNYPCFDKGWCSEPVCCGAACAQFGQCAGGVWPDKTHTVLGMSQGCGRFAARLAGGVLCCK